MRALLDGHHIRGENIPPEIGDLQLLEALGGYTLETLMQEQTLTVSRWRTIIGERNRWEHDEMERAKAGR